MLNIRIVVYTTFHPLAKIQKADLIDQTAYSDK